MLDLNRIDLNKSVLIVITHWNLFKATQKCIDSVRKYTDMGDVNLVIFDDCSDLEESVKWASESPELIIRTDKNYHHNSIVRQVLIDVKDTPIKYICALNNDLIVTGHWLRNMLLCMEKDSNIALMGSKDNMDYHWFQNFPIPDEIKPSFDKYFEDDSKLQEYVDKEFYSKRKPDAFVHTKTIDGSVMLFRNSLVKEIGGFNEEFDDYGADSEFFIRAQLKGYKIAYCLSSFVYHASGGQGGKYDSWLKNHGDHLWKAASEKFALIEKRYKTDITNYGRIHPGDVNQINEIERNLI